MKNKYFISRLCFITFVCLFPGVSAADSENVLNAEVNIYIDQIVGKVNRKILGNNIIGYKEKNQVDFHNNRGAGIWNPDSREVNSAYKQLILKAGVSMLRWPGGNWTAKTKWEKLVGPVNNRENNQFGLPEFLNLCEEVNAEPIITLPIKEDRLRLNIDLIEYLNSLNNGDNPNGGIDWAKVRSNDGHDAPWNVIYFEFGNESFNNKTVTPDEYIRRFKKVNIGIKAVDDTVKLGAVLEDSDNTKGGWTYDIVESLGDEMDFAIIHPYILSVNKDVIKRYSIEDIATAAVSTDASLEHRIKNYNDLIKAVTKRNDIKLAVTEYNGLFVQNKPFPFRFTLVNAILNADYLRVFLNPSNNILLANHWHLAGSYWGMLQEQGKKNKAIVKQANYYVFEQYNKYLNEYIVKLNILSPAFAFDGAGRIPVRMGRHHVSKWSKYMGFTPEKWKLRMFSGVEQTDLKGVLTVKFDDEDVNYYHASKVIEIKPNTSYRVSVKARVNEFHNGKIGIAIEDARGWKKTYNQPFDIQLSGTTDWKWLTTEIRTLPDAKKLRIMARRIGGSGPVSGIAQFSEIQIKENISNPGAVDSVVGIASVTEDKNTVSLLLINKSLRDTINTSVNIDTGYKVVSADTMTGASPFSSNHMSSDYGVVKISKIKIGASGENQYQIKLPPLSLTGVTLKK